MVCTPGDQEECAGDEEREEQEWDQDKYWDHEPPIRRIILIFPCKISPEVSTISRPEPCSCDPDGETDPACREEHVHPRHGAGHRAPAGVLEVGHQAGNSQMWSTTDLPVVDVVEDGENDEREDVDEGPG